MNASTQRLLLPGPSGELECALDVPSVNGPVLGLAVLCHPHPLHGGTMDNKVVQTLARSFVQLGWRTARFNFRGIGRSEGRWDEGRGEIDDALAVVAALRTEGERLALGGFSFGGYVAAVAAHRLGATGTAVDRLALVAPAVVNFEVAPVPAGTLVVHGEADDVVPLAAVLDWARPQSQPVTVVPGAGHFFHGQLTLLKNLILGGCR